MQFQWTQLFLFAFLFDFRIMKNYLCYLNCPIIYLIIFQYKSPIGIFIFLFSIIHYFFHCLTQSELHLTLSVPKVRDNLIIRNTRPDRNK